MKKARLKLRLSQKKLAKECGLSSGAIAGYEYDTIHPSKDALIKLGKIIDLKYLCCDDYSKFIISNYIEDLKSWRQKENLSIRAASKNLGIPSSTYIAWENGTYTISKDNYYKIKNKLKELAT